MLSFFTGFPRFVWDRNTAFGKDESRLETILLDLRNGFDLTIGMLEKLSFRIRLALSTSVKRDVLEAKDEVGLPLDTSSTGS